MVQQKVLVVFFSRTGTTRKLAETIGAAGGWDIEEIRDRARRRGVFGYMRCGFEATFGRLTRLREPLHEPSAYDLVVIGGPVWNASLSSPVRTYLKRHRAAFRKVAFFLTLGGSGRYHVFAQMQRACGQKPLAVLAATEREVARGDHLARARVFVEMVRAALPTDVHVAAAAPPRPETGR